MRVSIGIAAGFIGFVLYGALYYSVFTSMFPNFDLAMRMTFIGMMLSGFCFVIGFRALDGEGIALFAQSLALPLIGAGALFIVGLFLGFVSENIIDLLILGILSLPKKLYDLVTWIFFPVR